jgi:hypothetical protein
MTKRWAIVAAVVLVLLLGFMTIRYFYWLMYPGLPIYP